jgi:putative endonuclease
MLASKMGVTIYIGVTSDLVGRTYIHRENLVPGFTSKYGVHRLVWFERQGTAEFAIRREKQLKKWNRDWKIRLIEMRNPRWEDLYPTLFT